MTTAVLEDMMYLSYQYIYPAHIEKTMQLRFATDENSTKILRTMFDSLRIELSTALDLSCDSLLRTFGQFRTTAFASSFKSSEEKNANSLAKYVAGFTTGE